MSQDILELCMSGWGCCDCDGNQACFREAGMEISRLRYEVARLTLTDEERKAIVVVNKLTEMQFGESDFSIIVRKMLKRLGESQEDILRKVGA
jgi:hypothetical protein